MEKNKKPKSFGTNKLSRRKGNHKHKIFSQEGFVTVSVITLTPLLFILFSVFLCSVLFINRKQKLDNICYQFVLESQKALVDHNEKLLRLNSQARILIFKKKALNLVIATGTPSMKLKALLKRKAVIFKQKVLRAKQDLLLYRGNFLSRSKLFQLRVEMNKHLKGFSKTWPGRGNLIFNIKWKNSQIGVAVRDIAPVYKRSRDHSEAQTHRVTWTVDIKSILPGGLARLVPIQKRLTGRCESHPRKGGSRWYSEIGGGRRLRKLLSSVSF